MFFNRLGDEVDIQYKIDGTSRYPFESDRYNYSFAGRLYEMWNVNSDNDIGSFKGKVSYYKLSQILELIGLTMSFPSAMAAYKIGNIRIPRKHFAKFVEIINS